MDGDVIVIAFILIITVVVIIIIAAFVELSDFLAMVYILFYLDTCLKLWFGWLLFFGVMKTKLIYVSFLWWEDFAHGGKPQARDKKKSGSENSKEASYK